MASSSHLHRIALVTGASSGIGKATADRLAAAGWQLMGAARRHQKIQPEAELSVAGADASAPPTTQAQGWCPLYLDITDQISVDKAVSTMVERHGRLDALVHCAGISVAGSIEDVTIAEAEQQFATNYFGTVRMLRAVLPVMRAQGGGRIVVVGSIGGLIGLPFIAHYSASKFALDGLVEALRHEIRPFGVQVTIVHPGDIRTAISASQAEGEYTGPNSVYHDRFRATVDLYDKAVREARGPEVIAHAIERVLTRRRQPARIVAGTAVERAGVALKTTMPERWFELVIRQAYGL